MKGATYLRAYRETETRKLSLRRLYGWKYGIGVSDNQWALEWQRYDRLSKKLYARLEQLLTETECTNC